MSSNCLVFHTAGGISSSPAASLFLIFLSTKSSSSCVNDPSLVSNCLLLILVTVSCVNFGWFPNKFSKCCFHRYIRSRWPVAFSLALAMLFLLLTSITVCPAIVDCLFSTDSLILSIWFRMYSACSFRYVLANSFCAFLSFRALVLIGFFLMHLEEVFTSTRFSVTANVSHGTLGLVLCLFGIYFSAASKWALTKFSYSSFEVCVSVFSCSASNLFLCANAYLSLTSLLFSRDKSYRDTIVSWRTSNILRFIHGYLGTSTIVMVCKLVLQTITTEIISQRVLHTSVLVSQLNKAK